MLRIAALDCARPVQFDAGDILLLGFFGGTRRRVGLFHGAFRRRWLPSLGDLGVIRGSIVVWAPRPGACASPVQSSQVYGLNLLLLSVKPDTNQGLYRRETIGIPGRDPEPTGGLEVASNYRV